MHSPLHARGSAMPGLLPRSPRFGVAGVLIAAGLMAAVSPISIQPALAEAEPGAPAGVEQLKKSPTVNRGWLGVKIQNIDEDIAAALGLPDTKGALVSEVSPDSPAAGSGLKGGDAIIAVNGDKIADSRDMARKIAGNDPETTIDLKIWREDGEQTVKVKLGKAPASSEKTGKLEQKDSADEPEGMVLGQLGLKVAPAKMHGSGEGVAIAEVDPDSDAAQKGLMAGDIILRVDRNPVSSPEQVMESVKTVQNKGLKAVLLFVKSGEETRSVPVRFSVAG